MQSIPSSGAIRPLIAFCAATLLAGCATFSDDGGFTTVRSEAGDKLGKEVRWLKDETSKSDAKAKVESLLGKPLTADSAMQIALLSNSTLQAEYANLGIAEADLVQAGRLPNPGFSFGKTTGGGAQEIERGLHFNIMAVLTMPARVGIENRRFEAAKLAAAAATVEVALEARTAYFEAVAARQSLTYFEQVVDSADASRELMTRMSRVGNSSRLELAREQLFHAEATAARAMATRRERGAREAFIRALGLWGSQITALQLPDRLPDLPKAPEDVADLEKTAIAHRLDIRRAKHDLDRLSSSLELTQTTRFINVLEAGPAQVRERGEAIRDGYEVSLEIPIFDWGDAKTARAQAMYNQAADRLRATAINARSEVRQAYLGYRTAYDLARHYRDEVVPLRKRISDENLLRYNGMLIGVFELIADARQQVASVSAYLDALREFWISDTSLKTAMLAGSAPMGGAGSASLPSGANGGGH